MGFSENMPMVAFDIRLLLWPSVFLREQVINQCCVWDMRPESELLSLFCSFPLGIVFLVAFSSAPGLQGVKSPSRLCFWFVGFAWG